MAFNIFSAGDPLLASTMMQNFRHVNYDNNLLPVNSSGVGANNTLDLGSSTYKWKDLYLSNDAFVGDHLGVGTLTPQKKVHIHEATASTECIIRVTNAQNTAGVQFGVNSTDDCVIANLDADSDMIFYTGGANARATIKDDGDVGIGTSFPTSLFHIHKASATGVNLQITNSNTGATSGDGLFIGIDSSDNDAYIINKENKDLYFGVGNSEKMRLQYSTGYLGLGTNDPQRNLHINVSDSGVAFAHFTNSTTGSTTNDGFTIGLTENEDGFISVRENTDLIIETNNIERMRLTSDGKISTGGETAPDCDPGGITLYQTTSGGMPVTLKNSNVSHGMTSVAETDTFFKIKTNDAGWALIYAYSEEDTAFSFFANVTSEDTTTSGLSSAAFTINPRLKSGTGTTTIGDTANVFSISNGSLKTLIVKASGDIHTATDQTGGLAGTFDSEDDIILCQTLQHSIAGSDGYEHWDREIFNKNKDRLEELGIMKNGFLSNNKSKALLLGSVSQLYNIVKGLAKKLNLSEEQIMQMAKEY